MPSVEVFEEIDWAPKPMLRPGMDFHAGVTYFTIPLTRNLIKPATAKTPASTYKELQTFCITSDGIGFWYDEAALDGEGFLPSEQLYQERESRWSLDSAKAYLDGKTAAEDTETLFHEIRDVYTTYVEFADETSYDLLALYVMYTYVFRLFESTGYLHFNGTAASGKSRNLAILDALAFNTLWASSMTGASLYRKLAGSPGTTCIDESEGFDGERGEDLRRLLNAGYKDGAKAVRTEKTSKDKYMPVEYDVFGPKALASINPLEAVIASRCIIVAMRPAIRELPDFQSRNPVWADMRDRLYVWALQNAADIDTLAALWRTDKKARLAPRLIGRQWETASQFIILADFVAGEAFATKVIDFLNDYFKRQQDALDATDRLRTTLRALPRVLATKLAHPGSLYSTKDIHEVVSTYMEEDQKEYFKTRHVQRNLETLGFKVRVRAAGGVRIFLDEVEVRAEFTQRRVAPYDEDTEWLKGTVSYQNKPVIPDTPPADWWEEPEEPA